MCIVQWEGRLRGAQGSVPKGSHYANIALELFLDTGKLPPIERERGSHATGAQRAGLSILSKGTLKDLGLKGLRGPSEKMKKNCAGTWM